MYDLFCKYCKTILTDNYLLNNIDQKVENTNTGIEVIICPKCKKLLEIERNIEDNQIIYTIIDKGDIIFKKN